MLLWLSVDPLVVPLLEGLLYVGAALFDVDGLRLTLDGLPAVDVLLPTVDAALLVRLPTLMPPLTVPPVVLAEPLDLTWDVPDEGPADSVLARSPSYLFLGFPPAMPCDGPW